MYGHLQSNYFEGILYITFDWLQAQFGKIRDTVSKIQFGGCCLSGGASVASYERKTSNFSGPLRKQQFTPQLQALRLMIGLVALYHAIAGNDICGQHRGKGRKLFQKDWSRWSEHRASVASMIHRHEGIR